MTPFKIVFIVGPTGVGKSLAAVELAMAQAAGGEIVSCDAMQVYREVNIACDKPTASVRRQTPHHLLDVVSVTDEFDVSRYRGLAIAAIEDTLGRGKVPIVVGGSGMYMSVLLDGIFQSQANPQGPFHRDDVLRQQLQEKVDQQGAVALHQELQQLDPKAASKIHPNDAKRLIRALEVVMTLGKPISQLQKERTGLWEDNGGKYSIKIFGLNRPRAELYKLIEARVERMFDQGLVAEVQGLLRLPLSRTASTLIGIPEVKGYLNGEYDLERAKYLLKLNSRHFAKRQLTWFRRDERIEWINYERESFISHCHLARA